MIFASLLSLSLLTAPATPNLSITFFGCNRLDQAQVEEQATWNPSSANTVQLRQTLAAFRSSTSKVDRSYVLGDFVNGYADDEGKTLAKQLQAWSTLVRFAELPTLIPVPGNHELNIKTAKGKFSSLATTSIWNDWFDRFVGPNFTVTGPQAGGADKLVDDQSRLHTVWKSGGLELITINTDAHVLGSDQSLPIARVAVEWLREQVRNADADPSVKCIIVAGHRNLIDGKTAKGDAPVDAEDVQKLLAIFKESAKFRAYVCSHVHAYDVTELPGQTGRFQIIVGNGGSKLEKEWKPEGGQSFGYGELDVTADGVSWVAHLRPVPKGGYAAEEETASSVTPRIWLYKSSEKKSGTRKI